ncbi:MAG: hypothetical protein WBG92_02095 [Thiohalocapsa sp.]
MAANLGEGFALVQHLAATHRIVAADLIGKTGLLPIVGIERGMRVEPNRL